MQGRGYRARIARCACFATSAVLAVALLAGPAQATPTFLSALNISDAGQDGFEGVVAVDSTGVTHYAWTRSDGTNTRIQYRDARRERRLRRSSDDLRRRARTPPTRTSRSTPATTCC